MARNTWIIVQFLGGEKLEAVPSNWVEGNFCYWPRYDSNRMGRAMKQCEPRDKSWKMFAIVYFGSRSYDDYAKARYEAKKAEDTNDLQLHAGTGQKRKFIPRIYSSSKDEEESPLESSLPPPPKMARTIAVSDETPSPSTSYGIQGSVSLSNTNIENMDAGPSGSSCSSNVTDGLLEKLIQQNTEIIAQNQAMISEINLLKVLLISTRERVKALERKAGASIVLEEHFSEKFNYLGFPLNSTKKLEDLEEILQEEHNFQDAVNEFSKFGGNNMYDFTKRVLSSVLVNEVALKYSWLGRQAKQPFIKLKLAQVVICAAEKGKMEGSRKDTESAIQNWLKRAGHRIKAESSENCYRGNRVATFLQKNNVHLLS